jgi:hypothetical protein
MNPLFTQPDIFSLITTVFLEPSELQMLRCTSKHLTNQISLKIRNQCLATAHTKYSRVVRMPNSSTLRIHSSLGKRVFFVTPDLGNNLNPGKMIVVCSNSFPNQQRGSVYCVSGAVPKQLYSLVDADEIRTLSIHTGATPRKITLIKVEAVFDHTILCLYFAFL